MPDPPPPLLDPLAPGVESRPGLLRALGPGTALALVVGNVIGSGIFSKPGGVARDVGDFPLIIAAWVVGGGVCLLGALCFAELAAMLPRAGGLYVYLREAYGRPAAFLFGWSEFLFGKPASNGALAVIFIGSLSAALGWKPGLFVTIALAASLLAAMSWVNMIGVIWGGRVQALTTLVKAGFLGLVALLPFALLAAGEAGVDWDNYRSAIVPEKSGLTAQFAAAMLAVMWAYNGWHGITPVAEEIRDPQRNIPRALFGGIGILVLLYVGANLAYHGALSMPEMSGAGEYVPQAMMQKLLAPWGTDWAHAGVAAMSAVMMCSTFGAINSNILSGPRVSFAMGRDEVFFRSLGRVHVNWRTPAVAIIVQAAMSAALLGATGLYVHRTAAEAAHLSEVFRFLTNLVVFSASLFYVMAVLAVIVLRRKHPEWERPFRTPLYPLVPLAYLAFYLWFLTQVYAGQPMESQVGLVLVAAGLPVYVAWRTWAQAHPADGRGTP